MLLLPSTAARALHVCRRPAYAIALAVTASCLAITGRAFSAGPSPNRHTARSPFAVSLQRKFAILQRSRSTRGNTVNMPSDLTTALAGPGMSTYGPQPAEAEAVSVGPSFTAWLVPATKGICLFSTITANIGLPSRLDGTYFVTCRTATNASDGHSLADESVGTPNGGDWQRVWGLAPNGDSSVTITKSDGTSEAVPVVDNMYVAYGDASAQVTSVTLDDSGEPTTTQLPPS
jgi:hypothetical protein